uniref:Glutathione transferase n=1 Tax=Aureoumbra lagunensis TaxID=44058 RepID=A0A7S3NMA8_9STRA|mmetsp:Transcript_4312/g.6100  ORF Transcript_4312/g.6100 Transcript_4312/m.6100 type:complete len:249 (+) Transcript_4312:204-950(+)|eukprot:CAMPEP_0197291420 /NCGR_PEP_ID=MMETSP0890-20130614/15006_1 /TAXON_ID=44058 ORGANISM="Aureoumbra lagunensis, Strain CCMP1510" /NCGR_SAMPLE_ID=MMETSP0890 /ASSEMBLY_ACC=CAM_ASM_000533 /LENGTH=248 /DNA_ID=CAMNT_0042764377 /DNA_START=155 /DNA_END=901 /DNA_ORIENTATION=-
MATISTQTLSSTSSQKTQTSSSGKGKKYRLLYFNIEGKAEAIRLLFAYAGVQFEDYRFKDRAEFMSLKESGRLQFGQVPALEIENGDQTIVLTQTSAILRYLGKEFKPELELYPMTDSLLAAKIDAIVDQRADAYTGLSVAKYKERFGFDFLNDQSDLTEIAMANWYANILPKHLDMLTKLLQAGGTSWLAGTQQPSIADFVWCQQLKLTAESKPGILDNFPQLTSYIKAFYSLPAISKYYNSSCVIA